MLTREISNVEGKIDQLLNVNWAEGSLSMDLDSLAYLNLSKKIALKIKIQKVSWFFHPIMTNQTIDAWSNVKNI